MCCHGVCVQSLHSTGHLQYPTQELAVRVATLALAMLEEALYHVSLGVFNFNKLKGCDPIFTRNKSAKRTHIEYRLNMGKLPHQVLSESHMANKSRNSKRTHQKLPELAEAHKH